MSLSVDLVPTGTANQASVRAAFRRLGVELQVATPAGLADAPLAVVPGVGAFAAARAALEVQSLWAPLRERIAAGRPTLLICLGLQLLADSSQESPGVSGLEAAPGRVERFPDGLVVPHMGWNRVQAPAGSRYLEDGWAYYANSYRLPQAPTGWRAATSDYGGPFVAALERGAVLACQFHPELSGAWGQDLLARWLERAPSSTRREVPSCSQPA
jgi:imidazole glycerol-phosphate synthase subunit HisH